MNTKTIIINVIYTADIISDTVKIISTNKDSLAFPQMDISALNPKKNNINLNSVIQTIFEKYIKLDFNWSKPKLLDIELVYEEESNSIVTAIYYGIFIPHNTSIDNAYWIDIKPYVAHYNTLRKLVCML
jgi:hypothetical protein